MSGIWGWTCATLGHQRSKSQARRYGSTVLSRCRRCGARMVRLGEGDWRLLDGEEEATVLRTGRLPEHHTGQAA